jgi:hypothetical protein
VSDGNYIYILNGADSKRTRDTFYRYDPVSNTYTSLAQAPVDTVGHAAVYLDGRVYRLGGCSTLDLSCPGLAGVDVYDISTNRWTPPGSVADYPIGVRVLSVVVRGGYIYGAGGAPSEGNSSTQTFRYDPAENRWDDSAVTDLPYPIGGEPNGVVGDRWLFTTVDTGSELTTIGLDLGDTNGPWITVTKSADLVFGAASVSSGSALYLIGGIGSTYSVTPATEEYSELPCPGPAPTATTPPTPIPLQTSLPVAPIPDLAACGSQTNYVVTEEGGTGIVPGTTLAGEACDFCVVEIELPFTYSIYGEAFDRVSAGTDGVLAFSHPVLSLGNDCLPVQGTGYTIFPFWTTPTMTMDPRMNMNLGVYVSTSGEAPNRVFNIEWRACLLTPGNLRQCGGYANFEVRLYERQARFDIVYGSLPPGDHSVTVGVQDQWQDRYTQYQCSTRQDPSVRQIREGSQITFAQPECPGQLTPTPTPVADMAGGGGAPPVAGREVENDNPWYAVGLIGLGLLLVAALALSAFLLIMRTRRAGAGIDGSKGKEQ